MIDFVTTAQFLIIALRIAMVPMYFHIAQTSLFLETFFSHLGYPRQQFGTKNCPGGAR